MSEAIEKAKREVLWGVKLMVDKGYVLGTAGNISARVRGEDLFVITPSGYSYTLMTEDDLIVLDFEGNVVQGNRKPSVEVSIHRYIFLSRPDINAVIHTHSKNATAVSAIEGIRSVPILDVECIIYIGGDIAIAPFAPPGTLELAENVRDFLGTNAGVIMECHGTVGVGQTMEEAMISSDNVERSSEMFLRLLATGKRVKILPGEYVEKAKRLSKARRCVAER